MKYSCLLTHNEATIDDILIQGSDEEEIQQVLELIEHMKQKGWEMNPEKIQGPSETVKFLGIQWHCGHQASPTWP